MKLPDNMKGFNGKDILRHPMKLFDQKLSATRMADTLKCCEGYLCPKTKSTDQQVAESEWKLCKAGGQARHAAAS